MTEWSDDLARAILRIYDVPAAVAGFGWLEPDPNPMPKISLFRRSRR